MAWTERTSGEHWRVRYRRSDGSIGSEGGFTTVKAARSRAQEIDVDQRRRTFTTPHWPARRWRNG